MQATLPGGSPLFSNPLLFNNIFWDNRAGTYTGGTVAGIGLPGDPNPIFNWDLGVADGSGLLSPTNSLLQITTGTIANGSNSRRDPLVVETYDTSVTVQPWRGNPRFVDITMVTALATPNLLGDYHLIGNITGYRLWRCQQSGTNAPPIDIDMEHARLEPALIAVQTNSAQERHPRPPQPCSSQQQGIPTRPV